MIETWTVIGILGGVLTVLLALLAAQHGKLDSRIEGLGARLDGLGARLDGIHTRIDGLATQVDDLGTEMGELRVDVRDFGERMDRRFAVHEAAHRPGP